MADDNASRLKELLGADFLDEITRKGDEEEGVVVEDTAAKFTSNQLTNAKEITCECKTVILKPDTARLIIPSEAMLALEKNLNLQHPSQKAFSNLKRGCYWLVDDMYKFEQIGFTKEVKPQTTSDSNSQQEPQQPQATPTDPTIVNGLRYLVCAECNLCPLGWFNPTTKESYLYVW